VEKIKIINNGIKVAVLYQAFPPPLIDGVRKPMKQGGYADSGADIAYSLKNQGIETVTPKDQPEVSQDLDWVFPDTHKGISDALEKGANCLWLNTVTFSRHPIESFRGKGIYIVGQRPDLVDRFDDKLKTNHLLKENQLPIPDSSIILKGQSVDTLTDLVFPVVVKPVRGRGSQGVILVEDRIKLNHTIQNHFDSALYGDVLYIEQYLVGEELTITIMPPGNYFFGNISVHKPYFWSLPPVRRFNHILGIAPYNGTVNVVENSEVITTNEIQSPPLQNLCSAVEKAAELVEAKAPIRIDCRSDASGLYYLFDLNMKPNMTGPSRPHRHDQNSLTAMAAASIGWNFNLLMLNMLNQRWRYD